MVSGMVATSVDFDEDEGLVVRPAEFPATTEHTLAGTGEVLHIFEGDVTIRVPITHNGRSLQWRNDGSTYITVAGTVHTNATVRVLVGTNEVYQTQQTPFAFTFDQATVPALSNTNAVVRMDWRSEPAPGSLIAMALIRLPVTRSGNHFLFCSSVPWDWT